MALAPGTRLGRYEVLAPLGAGGMGEVYRALDTQLKREVAVKVLPESVAQDPDRLARFKREAQAVARLSHPSILEIHDFGSEAGVAYAVTELLEGQTLREAIPATGMAWQRASEIAAAVADGLAAAHGRGVVHRDLKPENIFITADGRVKILDFGLARVSDPIAEEAETASLTPAGTEPGTVMGTVGYMSPEQVRGRPADARSDLFALGCVLYEMLAGLRAFAGDTTAETMAAILKEDPPVLSGSGLTLPAQLEGTFRRCLEKSPEARFQSASDLAFALRSISSDVAVREATPTAVRPARGRRLGSWMLIGTAFLVAAIVVGWVVLSPSEPELPPPRTIPLTSDSGQEFYPVLSPDGRMVAYSRRNASGEVDLCVQLIDGGDPLVVSRGVGGFATAWSPESRRIAFARPVDAGDAGDRSGLFVVPALGGAERQIAVCQTSQVWGLSWSPDGETLAVSDTEADGGRNRIDLVSLETGKRAQLTSPPHGYTGDGSPRFSPDGRHVAFVRERAMWLSDIHVVAATGGEPRRLTFNAFAVDLDWAPDGRSIVFHGARPGRPDFLSLWRVALSGGEPEPLDVGEHGKSPTLSRQGNRLCYEKYDWTFDIWRIGGPAATEGESAPTRFISSRYYENFPRYSPDGRTILFGSFRSGFQEVWVCDSDGSNPTQLTFLEQPMSGCGSWSPDGRRIALFSGKGGNYDVYVIDAAGGLPHCLTTAASNEGVPTWSKDGRRIYFASDRTGRSEVFSVPADGGDEVQVTTHGGAVARESLDGRHLYFTKSDVFEGPKGIWRMPIGGGEETQIHDRGEGLLWDVLEEGIWYLDRDLDPPVVELLELGSGEVTRIADLPEGTSRLGFSVSPDRRWILFQVRGLESGLVGVGYFR